MRMAAQTAPIEAGAVHIPARAPWVEEFKKEILSFPASKHDDQIDGAISSTPARIRSRSARRGFWDVW